MTTLATRTWLLAGTAALVAMSLLILRSMPGAPQPIAEIVPLPPSQPAPVRTGQVVATRDIARGTSIDPTALGLSSMENPPEGSFTRVEEVAGRVALDRIRRGEPLTAERLSPGLDLGGLAPLVPVGRRAVTLRVADDTGVAFLIRPGDRVDIAFAARNDPEGRETNRNLPPDLSRMLLQDLTVLAVGEAVSAEPPQANAPARTGPPLRNVTLAATPDQFLLLGLARADGGYLMGLRNPQDHDTPELERVTRLQLLDAEPLPAPPPVAAAPERAPRPVRSGPEILRGPSSGTSR
jgi:pilus assembly protein CpaB